MRVIAKEWGIFFFVGNKYTLKLIVVMIAHVREYIKSH